MRDVLILVRSRQWIKNVFIFLPLFFNKDFGSRDHLSGCFLAFLGFSLITSAVYCVNDICDKEEDKLHPVKRFRPVAGGKVPVSHAWGIAGCLVIGGFAVLLFSHLPLSLIGVVVVYLLLMVGYCFNLKKIALVDVFVIGVGFVIRLVVGGIAGGITLSGWIVVTTFLLAIFLGFAKRLDDVRIYTETGAVGRKNIVSYDTSFLLCLLVITATVTIVSYLMYTVSPEVVLRFDSHYVYLTSLFVIMGIFRYLQLVIVQKSGGCPTDILLKDRWMQICIVLWVLSFFLIIYIL